MKKNLLLILIILCFYGCNPSKKQIENSKFSTNIETIYVDIEKAKVEVDISSFFESDIEVIPLETTENCLISDILKIEFLTNRIYISDRTAQTIFVFDQKGKYLHNIGKLGQGPGEYSDLGDFVLFKDSVFVKDRFKNKIIKYSNDGRSFREVSYDLEIYSCEFFVLNNNFYFVTNYSDSPAGYFNLFELDIFTGQFEHFLPFDKKIAQNETAWGLNKHVGKYKDKALLILAKNDTIYEVSKTSVSPKYIVQFSQRNLPEDIKEKGGFEAIKIAQSQGYIMGMNAIFNAKNYLFFTYNDGTPRSLIFNKKTREYEMGEWFIIGMWGNLYVSDPITTTDSEEFVFLQRPGMLMNAWKGRYSKHDFKDKRDRERLKLIAENIKEDDNPVIFKLKFKR